MITVPVDDVRVVRLQRDGKPDAIKVAITLDGDEYGRLLEIPKDRALLRIRAASIGRATWRMIAHRSGVNTELATQDEPRERLPDWEAARDFCGRMGDADTFAFALCERILEAAA